MTYPETLDWLFSKLPMYQRIGGANYKIDLANTHRLMELLEHPEKGLTCIHVAGTNGKGSVCHMLASIFQSHGYQVGLYTSPHLLDFRERIKINGRPISERAVMDFVNTYGTAMEKLQLSFFEMTVGLAFEVFREVKVDIAIIETGMGGRLDSTNVVTPEMSIITNIGRDHQKFLGDTLPAIAHEKAGIIKPGVPVVIGEYQPEVTHVFREKGAETGSEIYYSANLWDSNLPYTDLTGAYQSANLRTVLGAVGLLKDRWGLDDDRIADAVAHVVERTGLMGRWQTVAENPRIILEGAHNAEGLEVAIASIRALKADKVIWVFGTVSDKPLDDILPLLPRDIFYVFTQASIPRALSAEALYAKGLKHGLMGTSAPTVSAAIEHARSMAASSPKENTVIIVGGSLFVVADALAIFGMRVG